MVRDDTSRTIFFACKFFACKPPAATGKLHQHPVVYIDLRPIQRHTDLLFRLIAHEIGRLVKRLSKAPAHLLFQSHVFHRPAHAGQPLVTL